VVLLDFWATWCKPCRESIPHLVHLHRTYAKEGLVVLGINVDRGNPDTVRNFIASMEIPYPNVAVSQEVEKKYGITSLPTTLLIDKEGRVRERIIGFSTEVAGRLTERVSELLQEKR
jgi:thiol-disulfide isomerase/thioredoxin